MDEYFRFKKGGSFGKLLYLCSCNVQIIEIMEARTINVPVRIPKSYSIDLLQQQLTAYAQQLIDSATAAKKDKRHYRHEALCGVFSSGATEEELLEDYLQEKYQL